MIVMNQEGGDPADLSRSWKWNGNGTGPSRMIMEPGRAIMERAGRGAARGRCAAACQPSPSDHPPYHRSLWQSARSAGFRGQAARAGSRVAGVPVSGHFQGRRRGSHATLLVDSVDGTPRQGRSCDQVSGWVRGWRREPGPVAAAARPVAGTGRDPNGAAGHFAAPSAGNGAGSRRLVAEHVG